MATASRNNFAPALLIVLQLAEGFNFQESKLELAGLFDHDAESKPLPLLRIDDQSLIKAPERCGLHEGTSRAVLLRWSLPSQLTAVRAALWRPATFRGNDRKFPTTVTSASELPRICQTRETCCMCLTL